MYEVPDEDPRVIIDLLCARLRERLTTLADASTPEDLVAAGFIQQSLELLESLAEELDAVVGGTSLPEALIPLRRSAAIYADHADFRDQWLLDRQ